MLEQRDVVLNEHLHLWGWPIALYLFLGGLAAGLLVFASWAHLVGRRREYLGAVRAAALRVPPIVVVGLIVLWLDLGSKWTPFWLYLTFKPKSPMSWGAWILLATLLTSSLAAVPALHLYAVQLSVGGRRVVLYPARWIGPRLRTLSWINLALGAALGLYTGILLGTMVARPAFNSPILAPLFLISGLGVAAALLSFLGMAPAACRFLVQTEVTAQGLELGLLGLYLAGLATSSAVAQTAAASIAGGRWAWAFWSLVVVGGLIVPLGVGITELRAPRMSRAVTRVCASLALIGGLAMRIVLVYAGQQGW
jgi:formate-dependent nitrite reductase membrane component NrfD